MIYVVIEELNPEPHREHSRADLSTLGALRGFNSDDDSRRGAEVKSGEAAHGPISPPRDSALGSLNKGSPFFSVHELVSVRLSSSLRGGGFTDARRVFVPRQRGARVRERSIVRKGCRIHVRQNWEALCPASQDGTRLSARRALDSGVGTSRLVPSAPSAVFNAPRHAQRSVRGARSAGQVRPESQRTDRRGPGPPLGMPRPGTRRAVPSSTPAGIFTVSFSSCSTSLRPPHFGHGLSINWPRPPHSGQP